MMNKISRPSAVGLAVVAMLTILDAQPRTAFAQGTAFTYQGRLNSGGSAANGSYDLTFALFNASTGGSQVGGTITNLAMGVTNGLFTTTLEFGDRFTGNPVWLAVGARTNDPANLLAFAPLAPLQALTPAPYAMFANTASNVSGTVSVAQLPASPSFAGTITALGGFAGNGGGLTNVNAASLTGSGSVSNLALTGNLYLPTSPGQAVNIGIIYAGGSPFIFEGPYGGSGDFFAGPSAGNLTTSGYANLGVGWLALNAITSGADNSACGPQALQNNQSGSENTANGWAALQVNTTGFNNTADGAAALGGNTFGYYNTAEGVQALYKNTTGDNNTANGAFALISNTTNSFSTADGAYALYHSTGGNNIGLGYFAGFNLTTGSNNIDIGHQGLATDNNLIRIGSGQSQTFIAGNSFMAGLSLDEDGQNIGNVYSNALVFGGAYGLTGEGIASKRSGTNTSDLEFFTDFSNRMTIDHDGNVTVPGTVTAGNATISGNLNLSTTATISSGGNSLLAGLSVDPTGRNIGNVYSNALVFGGAYGATGEGIASKRNGTNPSDLEFFTDFSDQMTIDHSGNVWVNNNLTTSSLVVSNIITTPNLTAGQISSVGLFTVNATVSGQLMATLLDCGFLSADTAIISSNLSTGTLTIRGGSDVAEPFLVTGSQVEPGTVMVIDEANPGQLMCCTHAYDTRVAGIISGAGGIKPGISLQQDGVLDHGQKLALSGRAYVLADASGGAIQPGDLLTTSGTPGRAMKVSDHARAQGAILGKAMTALKDGQGMVLVLVTLQ